MLFHNIIGMIIVFIACIFIAIYSISETNKKNTGTDTLSERR